VRANQFPVALKMYHQKKMDSYVENQVGGPSSSPRKQTVLLEPLPFDQQHKTFNQNRSKMTLILGSLGKSNPL
jgi:hypothetical protein